MQYPEYPYLNELNEIQQKAVMATEGPVMVIAGPGSGKTRVLTYRIAHILNLGVPPWQILALTFTNKAAREMKERIEKVAGTNANRIWAGTFHSLFARILRGEAHRIGYPNDFSIYDTDDSKSVIKEIVKSMGLDPKNYTPNSVLSRISAAKSNLITPKLYVQKEELMDYDRMNNRPMIHEIYQKYSDKCMRAGAMDFDDLLLQMFRLLYQNPDNVREKFQRQFQYVMVDEFQDTNYLQYEIVKLLVNYPESKHNVCIVGDDAQSIYSFRGATIENILHFETDFPQLQTFKLEQNYRSTPHIIEAANHIINNNKRQIQKKIWTDKDDGQKIKIIRAMTDTEEGKRVADSIIEQKNRFNLSNKDFSILYRTNPQSRIFEEALRRHSINYKIYGGMSFYQRKEVKDMIAYLRLTVNDKDDEALKRIINYPKRGIGNKTISDLQQIADANNMSLWQALVNIQFGARANKKLIEFVELIKKMKAKSAVSNAYETALFVSRRSGITELLKADKTQESMERVENINALLDGIKEFVEDDELEEGEEITGKSMAEFLQTISLMTDADETAEDNDFVTLMSVHASKGLEFPSVFVVGLEENLFPSYRSLSDANQVDEERRLFYVAITRAEKYLTLSYANNRYQYGQVRSNDPSRFIEELPEQAVDNMTILNYGNSSSGQFDFGKSKSPFGQPRVVGNFKKKKLGAPKLSISPDQFKASPSSQIKEGHTVIHMKFGEGKVTKIDDVQGIAHISFDNSGEVSEKRIVLRFAKLMIKE